MNPALKPILAAIESAVVRIEYARDDEHALNEAIQLAADARALLAALSGGPAFTEADPVPASHLPPTRFPDCPTYDDDPDLHPVPVRRNCLTCAMAPNRPSDCDYPGSGPLFDKIVDWAGDNTLTSGDPKPDADNCPGYTLRDSAARITAKSP